MQNAKINIAYAILIIDFDILFLSLGGHVYYLCFPAFCQLKTVKPNRTARTERTDLFVREKLEEWNLSCLTDILEGQCLVSVDIQSSLASFDRKKYNKASDICVFSAESRFKNKLKIPNKLDIFVQENLEKWNLPSLTDILEGQYFNSFCRYIQTTFIGRNWRGLRIESGEKKPYKLTKP